MKEYLSTVFNKYKLNIWVLLLITNHQMTYSNMILYIVYKIKQLTDLFYVYINMHY